MISQNTADTTYFNYNKDPHQVIYEIFQLNVATGTTTTIASGPGGSARPVISQYVIVLLF